MKKFKVEFKKFINKGNALELAVGIIIGTAFTAIINSIVNDVLMPLITMITGTSFSNWIWVVNGVEPYIDGVVNPDAIIIHYGKLIQAIINFFIIALTLFLLVKTINKTKDIITPKYYGFTEKEYFDMLLKGKTKKQIAVLGKEKAEEEAKAQKEAEEEKKKHTTEALLEDIKNILEKQSNTSDKRKENT